MHSPSPSPSPFVTPSLSASPSRQLSTNGILDHMAPLESTLAGPLILAVTSADLTETTRCGCVGRPYPTLSNIRACTSSDPWLATSHDLSTPKSLASYPGEQNSCGIYESNRYSSNTADVGYLHADNLSIKERDDCTGSHNKFQYFTSGYGNQCKSREDLDSYNLTTTDNFGLDYLHGTNNANIKNWDTAAPSHDAGQQGFSLISDRVLITENVFYPDVPFVLPSLALEQTLACRWLECNTTHSSSKTLAFHWKNDHLTVVNDLAKLQLPTKKKSFCLWNECGKNFERPSDLDRHVQSVHLHLKSNCTVPRCDNNGGKGFSRPDKLRAHEKKEHEFY